MVFWDKLGSSGGVSRRAALRARRAQSASSLPVGLEGQKGNGEYDDDQLATNLPHTLECSRRYSRCPLVDRVYDGWA